LPDIRQEVLAQGLVAEISGATIWRWLSQDAIRPGVIEAGFSRAIHCFWKRRLRSSISTRVFGKDNPWVLMILYFALTKSRVFKHHVGNTLRFLPPLPFQLASSTSMSARELGSASLPGTSGAPKSSVVAHTGTGSNTLMVWDQEPYRSAKRVFWIIDNCSVHRGQKCVQRLQARWPSIVPVHTPNHASWLNQVEIYFSVVQRKLLTPNDFPSLAQLEEALLAFQQRYEKSAAPFQWTFTREGLTRLTIRLRAKALATAA
jgi:hypothetical protein